MKSVSCKYVFMLFETERDCKPPLTFRRGSLKGFTLLEILVAMTIIVTIVSMVYGSYFATAKSADACKTRMTLSGQTRKVLNQMSRQIRCSYIGEAIENTDLEVKDSKITNRIRKSPVIYFSYEPDAPGSETLYLVTTNRLFCEDGHANGLIDAAYKFDKNIGTLYLSQRKFAGTTGNNIEDRNWRPLLANVESVELDFFDGRQWGRKWDFEQKRKLPIAVKISITCEDENSRKCHYGTVAYVDCSRNQDPKTLSEKSVSKQ
ncbi:MAG: prepilin-type N-terminal cleavage/methylation domain-containing protein [Planctomycetes bacterium]|nr:prepilin-type N-terminal cleavage/methylation domain-containing protein [Planctomycetota bacterium]